MRRQLAIALLALAALAAGCGSGGKQAPQSVTLALDFTPNAAHSGIYDAVAERRDRDHGVRLVIRQPSASTDSLKLLAAGRADLAVVDIHDLGLARERGADLVGVAALVQRPLASVIATASVKRPRELEGKRVGVTGLPSDNAVLRSVVEGDGGTYGKVRRQTIGFNAVPALATGKVDAATGFWNAEGVALRRRGVKTSEFRVDEYGAPRYPELVLVTRRSELGKSRKTIEEALAAIRDGTRAALASPAPAVNAIATASGAERALVQAEFDVLRPALVPPLRLDPAALRGWAAFDVKFGILSREPDLGRAFDTSLSR